MTFSNRLALHHSFNSSRSKLV